MKKLFLSLVILNITMSSGFSATSGLNPSSLKLKIYKVAVSASKLCTSPITIFETTTPTSVDFLGSPTLGSGDIATGSYPCVIIEFEDNIKPTPATTSTSGYCTAGTEFTLDVCRSPSTSKLIDGTTTTCTSGADRVAMYLSTGSTSTSSGDAFNPPTVDGDSAHGFNLASALTVSAETSGTFVVNGAGKIEENGTACECQPPIFSFR